jgi:glycerol-3-phosphate acyltransferase PlsY|tara:strand:- start:350 stop:931 length:582 start_codon:yes stop_codon:yes gene_type:complete
VILEIVIVLITSYLLGSIPFGYIITKFFLKEDIRDVGSGNIGATNVLRTGKKFLATLTLAFDILKGYLVVFISLRYFPEYVYSSALICFLGHIFPIWLKFKGGKGVATYLGIILAFSLNLGLIFGISWIIILFLTKYSSLSSIIGAFNVFIFSFLSDQINPDFLFFTFLMIIIFTHKQNIIRLKDKKESKIKF